MRMVSPDAGVPEVQVATEQHEYNELTAGLVEFSDGSRALLTRWRLTDNERERVASGDDLYVTLLTFGQPMQPITLSVGQPEYLR